MVKSKKSRLSGLNNPEVLSILGELALERYNKLRELEKKEKAIAESIKSEEDSHEHYYAPSTISHKIKKKKQITKKKSKAVVVPLKSEAGESTPEWLLNYMRRVDGSDPKKIINKKLFKTDLSKSHCRLSIPVKQVVEKDFLKEEELRVIEEEGNKGIKAVLIDEEKEEWNVELRKWDMNSTSTYVLVDGWTRLFQERGYVAGDQIRLWSFRSHGILHFALVPPSGDAGKGRSPPTGESGQDQMKKWDVELKRWGMNSTSSYVLVNGWTQVLQDKGFVVDDQIRPPSDAGQASSSSSGDAGQGTSSTDDAGQSSSPIDDLGQSSSPTGNSGQCSSLPGGGQNSSSAHA